mmetsp:Transcript_611/g.2437  ORF Transcript_611/g.2437 Transcript_611/m.2437 type:complete len:280 (+) Transcript_611:925-1764(+)
MYKHATRREKKRFSFPRRFYFHSFFRLMFLSLSFFMTFDTAISKSSCVTWTLLSLRANMPASVQHAFISAPDAPTILSAIFFKSIPLIRFIFLLWILRMSNLELSLGFGNSIFLSIRPGLSSAESRMSILFVAIRTLILFVASNPSSWLRSSSMVRCTSESPPPEPPSILALPMESTSSMKMIEGACSLAMTKSSRTILLPSPMYFCTSSEPLTRMNVQSVWWATALASRVFPVPGGPYRRTPLGWAIPRLSKSSGCLIGSSITSLISLICWSSPPIMS